mgnify:CR=1 FL=1
MDDQVLYPALAVLCAAVALNLKLTLCALRAARSMANPALPLAPGEPVPAVAARRLAGRAPLQLAGAGQAWALLYLSSQCPKCRDKLPDIDLLLDAAAEAGLAIWLVSEEPGWRLRRFLRGRRLLQQTAIVSRQDYKLLNPNKSTPAYQFVNHEGMLEAGGFIGDDDWLALHAQLTPAHSGCARVA